MLMILLKTFLELAAYLQKIFTNLIKTHNDACLKQIKY